MTIELADLEIMKSNILQIPDRIFTVINVKVSLSLFGNAIQSISENTFLGLNTVRDIFLHYNNISYIHKDAFRTLHNLNRIIRSHNQIHSLDSNVFLYMNSGFPFHSSGIIPFYSVDTGEDISVNISLENSQLSNDENSSSIFNNKKYIHLKSMQFVNPKMIFSGDTSVLLHLLIPTYKYYVRALYVQNTHTIKYSALFCMDFI